MNFTWTPVADKLDFVEIGITCIREWAYYFIAYQCGYYGGSQINKLYKINLINGETVRLSDFQGSISRVPFAAW